MPENTPDPIVGDWNFPRNNLCTFTPCGKVLVCGSRVGVWKKVDDRKYMIAYLRGHFDGASDPLQILDDGKSMKGLANGNLTRDLERADSNTDPTSIVGQWDFKNGNISTYSVDGWVELCGMRVAIWVREDTQTFLTVYLRGYFGGASDPVVLSDDGNSMEGLFFGCWETGKVNRANV